MNTVKSSLFRNVNNMEIGILKQVNGLFEFFWYTMSYLKALIN